MKKRAIAAVLASFWLPDLTFHAVLGRDGFLPLWSWLVVALISTASLVAIAKHYRMREMEGFSASWAALVLLWMSIPWLTALNFTVVANGGFHSLHGPFEWGLFFLSTLAFPLSFVFAGYDCSWVSLLAFTIWLIWQFAHEPYSWVFPEHWRVRAKARGHRLGFLHKDEA